MAKDKSTSEVVLMNEFNHYGYDAWSIEKSSNPRVKRIINIQTDKVYDGVDATFLISLKVLEDMRRNKKKLTPLMELQDTYHKYFSIFNDYFDVTGVSLDSFLTKFKMKSKTIAAPKLYEALLREFFPYAIPKHLKNAFYDALIAGNGRSNLTFKNFLPENHVNNPLSANFVVPLSGESWKKQKLVIYKNSIATWIAVIGLGHSFYKVLGYHFFNKSEAHNFLNAPEGFSLGESLVYAVAYAHARNRPLAMKLSKQVVIVEEFMSLIFGVNPFVSHYSFTVSFSVETILEYIKINMFNSTMNRNHFVKMRFMFDVVRFFMMDCGEGDNKKIGEVFDFLKIGYWNAYTQKVLAGDLKENNHNKMNSKKVFKSKESEMELYGLNKVKPEILLKSPELFGRGLSFANFYSQTVAWHYELASQKIIGEGSWSGLALENYSYKEINSETGVPENEIIIEQILTAADLQREGRLMRHCVSTYVSYCRNGTTGIFQMYSYNRWREKKKMLTIRVSNRGEIVEARGLANRDPKSHELSHLRAFANKNYLKIHRSVYPE